MADLSGRKESLREAVRQRLLDLSWQDRRSAAVSVSRVIDRSRVFGRCQRLSLYAAHFGELSLANLAARCALRGKGVLWPRVVGRLLEFAPAKSADLVSGTFGILAPPEDIPPELLGSQDVILVPGLAFDRFGGRLGRGGGYYDRSFPGGVSSPLLIGVGYAFQVVSKVPTEVSDRRMDAIATEHGLRWSVPSECDAY